MTIGIAPNDIYQNGDWYNRAGRPLDNGESAIAVLTSRPVGRAQVGDVITVVPPDGVVLTSPGIFINKGAGYVSLASALTFTLTSSELPAEGVLWPIVARGTVGDGTVLESPPIYTGIQVAPTVLTYPVITGTVQAKSAVTVTAATFSAAPAATVLRTYLLNGEVVWRGASYTLPENSTNSVLTVWETATNAAGSVTVSSVGVAVTAVPNVFVPTPSGFVDVVIFAGQSQSNSNGTSGTGGDVPASLQGPMANAFTWDPFNKVWLTYEAGVNSSVHLEGGKYLQPGAKYHGMEAEYLRRWRESNPGVPIYMIKKGHSTTSLSPLARTANRGCWDPSLTGVNSDLFEELVAWVIDACANIRAAGKTPRFRGFNWIQGENDADNLAATNLYQANLTAFIAAVRTRLDSAAANMPFIISRIQTSLWQNAAALRAAQEATAAAVANTRWFDADGASLAADAVHYNPAGCLFLGRICYDAGMSAAEITTRYISRMTTAPSAGRQATLTTLFSSLVDKSVWPTVAAMQLYASHDQQSALVSAGYADLLGIAANETFVVDRGATGSGTASHIDTNFNPTTTDGRYRAGGNSQSVWIRTKPDNNGIDIGAFAGGVVILGVSVPNTSIRVTASADVNNIVSTVTKTTGLTTVQRLGATDSRLYQDGVQLGTPATSPTGTLPTSNLWVGDRSGGTSGPTIAQYSAFLCGAPRTAQQEADLYAALNTYLTAIGAV